MKLKVLGLALLAFATAAGAQQTVTQVRASPATFSAGTTAPLQSDTHGALQVTGAVTSTAAVTGNGTAATAQRVTIASDSTGQVALAAGSNAVGTVTAVGNVASAVTDSGNPIKFGCPFNSTAPTVTTGQRVDCQSGTRGSIHMELWGVNAGSGMNVAGSTSDGIATSAANGQLGLGLVYNGATMDRMRGDVNGQVIQPGLSTTYWYYTSGTSAILSNTTTAVTIKTAAGASVRNYIDACQIASTALGASVPLAIRDGAAGTVIWAMRPPTAGWTNPVYINFSPPLRSTANTLLEIVTTTADTSGTFDVNCQGHTGT